MKNPEQTLLSHLSQEVITIAHCCKITFMNGTHVYFTDCDHDLTVDGVSYFSNSHTKVKLISHGHGNSTAQIEFLPYDTPIVADGSLLFELYTDAKIEILLVNYSDISQGSIRLFIGKIREISLHNHLINAYLIGDIHALYNKVGSVFSQQCRAQFCDSLCKLSASKFSIFSTVSSILDKYKEFGDSTLTTYDNYYKYGLVTFLSGNNKQCTFEIHSNTGTIISLASRTPYPISVDDQYSLLAGCDKNFHTCITKFQNAVNFRGEPHVPDPHSVFQPID
ncbi:DUF2163 domain-containing protein [Anaplasma phagocytophilum]|uniref:Bacteriophage phiJL001 Gp84 C-terminal domain-containing protein n=1 Tax=Anaplasma phagocytophilum TaxID=948 RepID=A0A098EF65_ANAPH|nr:DUF2163 domain-containing protein [Anaplasma phagocytophilum]CEG20909.1 Uncharacterized protein ANAPHAGO_00100 [Anaplasma phagocytophilum]